VDVDAVTSKLSLPMGRLRNTKLQKQSIQYSTALIADFCNKICQQPTSDACLEMKEAAN
jgi:hypothetical protein